MSEFTRMIILLLVWCIFGAAFGFWLGYVSYQRITADIIRYHKFRLRIMTEERDWWQSRAMGGFVQPDSTETRDV